MSYNKKVVLRNNIEAIRTVLLLEAEKRIPSKEEREILGRYNGFGGLKCVLNPASTLADRSRWAKSELELFPDRKSTRLNSSHKHRSRMPSSA